MTLSFEFILFVLFKAKGQGGKRQVCMLNERRTAATVLLVMLTVCSSGGGRAVELILEEMGVAAEGEMIARTLISYLV